MFRVVQSMMCTIILQEHVKIESNHSSFSLMYCCFVFRSNNRRFQSNSLFFTLCTVQFLFIHKKKLFGMKYIVIYFVIVDGTECARVTLTPQHFYCYFVLFNVSSLLIISFSSCVFSESETIQSKNVQQYRKQKTPKIFTDFLFRFFFFILFGNEDIRRSQSLMS